MTIRAMKIGRAAVRTGFAAGLLAGSAAIPPAAAQVPMGGSGAASTALATFASSGAVQTLAFATAGNAAYDITLTANTVFTISGGTAGQFQSMTLLLREGALGGFVPSLPASIQWASGAAPAFSTVQGAVNTVVLNTSDGGKTIAGLAGGASIGTVAGTARDAAAAIAAEAAAAAATTAEAARAQSAEAALLPKATTTLAGLTVASSPSAAQVAAALPAFTTLAQGLVPAPPLAGSNLVLGQSGWTMATGGGNVSTDTGGSISTQVVHAAAGAVNRTLSARASDTFNVRDYGAVGNGSATAIGTTYGSTLAALASYTTAAGVTPFAWATNPLFGLAFTMTTTAQQGSAGNTLNFAYPLTDGAFWNASAVAPWQDPSHQNFLLRPGMLVSGSCIGSGTYVGTMPSTIIRQGELLPGATDWKPGTAYAADAEVFANGNFYRASTGGTSASSGGPTGTGSGIGDGSAAWAYMKPSEATNLMSGAVTLVNAGGASVNTASACPNGAAITFTIAPAQLQALTFDWLGIQAAVAQAYASPTGAGGTVYMPAGLYQLNHSIMNPAGTSNSSAAVPAVNMVGDGRAATQLQFPVDLGQDECGIAESTRSPGWDSFNRYEDFRLFGNGNYTAVNGVSPNKMDGLCFTETASAYRLTINNMRAGINLVNDHQTIRDYSAGANGYGILFAPYSNSIGNQEISGGGVFGYIAGIGISSSNQFDSGLMSNVHTGFGPYGFYSIPSTPNLTQTNGAAVSNDVLDGVWTESIGAAWMKGSQTYSNFNVNTLINIGGGMVNNYFSIGDGRGGTVQPRAEIDVYGFIGNTMIATGMAPYGVVSDAVVEASGPGGCPANRWIDDQFFVFNATAAVPMIKCIYGTGDNVFQTAQGDGIIVPFDSAVAVNQPVADHGNTYGPYIEGRGFAGVAAVPIAAGNAGPVITHSVGFGVTTATPGQTINGGVPVFVTGTPSPGIAAAIDPGDAIGTTQIGGTGTVLVAIEPIESRGSARPDTGETAPSPGTVSAANCYAIKSPVTQFSTVPNGGCAVLALAPMGKHETIYNDGSQALAVLPPAGSSIGTLGTNAPTSLAPGATATYYRIGATQWH